MKLTEKGRFAPPPKLKGAAAQQVSASVAEWTNVHARAHWYLGDEQRVDGADFYLGQWEVGHIHLGGEAHIMMPPALASANIAAGHGTPSPWSKSVLEFDIDSVRAVEHALWLFRLSYDWRSGVLKSDLLRRVQAAGDRSSRARS